MARNLTPDQIKGLAGNSDVAVDTYPSADTYYMAMNQKDEHLKNPKVRQAIRWLVDYDGMVNTFLKGQYIVHQSFWPSGFFASYDENPFKLDVAKAKGLLAEAGYPNGFDITLDTSTQVPFTDIAQNIQQTFAQAGINLKIKQQDSGQLFPLYRAPASDGADLLVAGLWTRTRMPTASRAIPTIPTRRRSSRWPGAMPG
jgi:peptide/nickel transport system substrate-binding protein